MMKDKKILILISSLSSGGAERVTVKLTSHLKRIGNDVTVATIRGQERDFYSLDVGINRIAMDLGGEHFKGPRRIFAPVKRFFEIKKIIQVLHPDVILGMMTKANIYALLGAYWINIPVVVSERNYLVKQALTVLAKIARKILYKNANAAIVLTNEAAIWVKENIKMPNVYVIPPSISLPLPALEPNLGPYQFLREKDFVFLSVGRLHHQKGHDMLIKAFSSIAVINQDARLVILGEGEKRNSLEMQIIQCGLGECIFLPGNAGNISDWYDRADVFVLPSRYEGFSNSLLEAMAHGCACISFDCNDGPRDMITNEENGLLIEPENIDLLALAMRRMMEHDDERERLAKRAKEVLNTFSDKVVLKEWVDLLDEILCSTK